MKKLKKNNFLDIDILLSKKYKLPARLVAIKLPESVVNQRRRKLRSTRDASMNPSKEHFEWLGWSIYITNVDKATLNCKEISDYYSLRWEIEIIFKSWKSSFNFKFKDNVFSKEQLMVLLFARLAIIAFTIKVYSELLYENKTEISIIKLFKFIAENQFIFLTKNCLFCSPLDFIHIISKVTSYEARNRSNMKQKIKKILFTNP